MANRYDRDARHWTSSEWHRDENPWDREFRGKSSRNWPSERSAWPSSREQERYSEDGRTHEREFGPRGTHERGEEAPGQYWQHRGEQEPYSGARDERSARHFGESADYGRGDYGRRDYGRGNYGRGDYGRGNYGRPEDTAAAYGGNSSAYEDERRFGSRVREFFSSNEDARGPASAYPSGAYTREPYDRDRESYGHDRQGSRSYGSGPSYAYYSGPTYGIGYDSRSYGAQRLGARSPQGGSYSSHAGLGPKGYSRSDQRIREDVCDRLSLDDEVDASDITVSVRGGEVTLEGTVETRRMKHRAEDIAEAVAGVSDVHNSVKVRKGILTELADKVIGKDEEPQHHAGSGTKTTSAISTAGTSATSTSSTTLANGRT